MNKKLKLSKMSGKLLNVGALNTSPLNNDYCQSGACGLMNVCYSISMLSSYRKNCNPNFVNNGEILSKQLLSDEELLKLNIKEPTFRFHAHGELINEIHFRNFVRIAELFPGTFFSLYTKRLGFAKKLDREKPGWKPKNMNIIFSSININQYVDINKLPKFVDKVFTVYTKDYVEENKTPIHCATKSNPKKCFECKLCYEKNSLTNINEILKKR